MMSRKLIAVLALASLALSGVCSSQSPDVTAQELYQHLDQVYSRHDNLREYLNFADPNLTLIDPQGQSKGFDEWRKQMVDEYSDTTLRGFRASTKIIDVQLQGQNMLVRCVRQVHFQRKNGLIPGWEWYTQTTTEDVTWQKTAGEWKALTAHFLKAEINKDF